MRLKRRAISTAQIKKGLAPASLLHFRMEETSGDVLTDDVVGALFTRSGGVYNFDTPNAVSNLEADNGGSDPDAGGKVLLTNMGIKIASLAEVTSGYIVLYATANFHRALGGAGAICGVTDFGTGGGFFSEYASDSIAITGGSHDTTLEGLPNIAIKDVIINSWEANAYTYVCKISFNEAPAFRYADSLGNIFNLDERNPNLSVANEPFIIDKWDLTKAFTATLGNVKAYISGALYLEDEPTDADMLYAANWHSTYAPHGQKDVCPVWNKYKKA